MTADRSDYPQYFEYDDIPVIAEMDDSGTITYKNWNGVESESARKAPVYGNKTSKEAFEAVSKAYKDYLVDKVISEQDFHKIISEHYGTQFYN